MISAKEVNRQIALEREIVIKEILPLVLDEIEKEIFRLIKLNSGYLCFVFKDWMRGEYLLDIVVEKLISLGYKASGSVVGYNCVGHSIIITWRG